MEITSKVTTTTNLTGTQQFGLKQSAVMFDVLTAKLYTNPVKAIVRELLTNAYDSHVVAKSIDTEVDVHLPNYADINFSIRDYGTGLSEEAMTSLYVTFFDSTKNQDNELTGGFGLGSKTPFAYTDSFFVNSYKDGKVHKYVLFKNNKAPSMNKLTSLDTDEPNGLEIIIPVREGDRYKFNNEVEHFAQFNPEVKLNITGGYIYIDKPTYTSGIYTWYTNSSFMIKQGQNVFYMSDIMRNLSDKEKEKFSPTVSQVIESSLDEGIVIEVPIGTLEVAPNRESLHLDSHTVDTITDIITEYSKFVLLNKEELISAGITSILKFYLVEFKNDTFDYVSNSSRYSKDTISFKIPSKYSIWDVNNFNFTTRSGYGYDFILRNEQEETKFIFITGQISPYRFSKLKRSLNTMDRARIIYVGNSLVTEEEQEELKVNCEQFCTFMNKIESFNYKYSVMSFDEFFKEYTPAGTDKILSKSYRVLEVKFKNINNSPRADLYFENRKHVGLTPITDLDDADIDSVKFKILVTSEDDKNKIIDDLKANVGFNNMGNTLFNYVVKKQGLAVAPTFIQLVLCHKEAYKNSILDSFSIEDYNEYIEDLNGVLKPYIASNMIIVEKASLLVECFNKKFKSTPKYSVIKNNRHFKVLKALSKYKDCSDLTFSLKKSEVPTDMPKVIKDTIEFFDMGRVSVSNIQDYLNNPKQDRWSSSYTGRWLKKHYKNILNKKDNYAQNSN